MKIRFPLILTLALFCSLTGCGFTPLYGVYAGKISTDSQRVNLNSVTIDPIPNREGVYLRNALIDRFYQNGYPTNPLYKLNVSKISENKRDLDITKSAEATRSQLFQRATLILYQIDNPTVPVLTRQLSATSSFNTLESEFATRVTEDNARLSGLNDLARQIELNVSLFLGQGGTSQ